MIEIRLRFMVLSDREQAMSRIHTRNARKAVYITDFRINLVLKCPAMSAIHYGKVEGKLPSAVRNLLPMQFEK